MLRINQNSREISDHNDKSDSETHLLKNDIIENVELANKKNNQKESKLEVNYINYSDMDTEFSDKYYIDERF